MKLMILPLWTQTLLPQVASWFHLWTPVVVSVLQHDPPPAPNPDPTGVSTALQNLAKLLAGMVVGVACLALVVCGLLYISAFDDVSRAMHVRRAIGAIVIGLLLVVLAATIAPQLISAIQPPTSH
ncbi:TrbC/VirB2 family protein [Thermogemmatispora sp.]|uniref:TrbC/VirB2 family protein n=1 Tax=Thermogemmatispora sp. TaxID=1968838 RepID=UPI0035E415EC